MSRCHICIIAVASGCKNLNVIGSAEHGFTVSIDISLNVGIGQSTINKLDSRSLSRCAVDFQCAFTGNVESAIADVKSSGSKAGTINFDHTIDDGCLAPEGPRIVGINDGNVIIATSIIRQISFSGSGTLLHVDLNTGTIGLTFLDDCNLNGTLISGNQSGNPQSRTQGHGADSRGSSIAEFKGTCVFKVSGNINGGVVGSDGASSVEEQIHLAAILVTIVITENEVGFVGQVQVTFTAVVTHHEGIGRNVVSGTGTGAFDGDGCVVNIHGAAGALAEDDDGVGAAAQNDFSAVLNGHHSVDIVAVVTDLDFTGKLGIVNDDLAHDVHGVDLVFTGGIGDGKSTVAADTHISSLEDLISHNVACDITEDHLIGSGNSAVVTDDHLTAHIDIGVGSEINAAGIFFIAPVTDVGVRGVEVAFKGIFTLDIDRALVDGRICQISIIKDHGSGNLTDLNGAFACDIEGAFVHQFGGDDRGVVNIDSTVALDHDHIVISCNSIAVGIVRSGVEFRVDDVQHTGAFSGNRIVDTIDI